MEKQEILRQCLEWNKELEEERKKHRPDSRYIEKIIQAARFTKKNLEKLAKPKFNELSVVSQTVHNEGEYPIFFIRERQIMHLEGNLTWAYFGSLFDIKDEKVNYRTTTSFIPEKIS